MLLKKTKNKIKAKMYVVMSEKNIKYYEYMDNPLTDKKPFKTVISRTPFVEHVIIDSDGVEYSLGFELTGAEAKANAKSVADAYNLNVENL